MILNLAADAAGGSIPVLGDIWDFLFRAHARNHALLRARLDEGGVSGKASDTWVVLAAVLALLAALAIPVVVAVSAWRSAFPDDPASVRARLPATPAVIPEGDA
jgi:hypothetical protein